MQKYLIRTDRVEEIVREVVGDEYSMTLAARPSGEDVVSSVFVFELTGTPQFFTTPDKFYLRGKEEEGKVRFELMYDDDERFYIHKDKRHELFHKLIGESIGYSSVLNIKQMEESAKKYLESKDWIDVQRQQLDEDVQKIVSSALNLYGDDKQQVKSENFYKLLGELKPILSHVIGKHYTYMLTARDNPSPEEVKAGNVYWATLPLGTTPDFGGGTGRPVIIVGKSTNDFYYAVPLSHSAPQGMSDGEREEYNIGYDRRNGTSSYIIKGRIECLSLNDLGSFIYRVDKDTYKKVISILNRDIRISTSLQGDEIGFAGASKKDALASYVSMYEENFKMPSLDVVKDIIVKKLEALEGNYHIYKRKDDKLDCSAYDQEDSYEITFYPESESIPFVVKYSKNYPTDIMSNFKYIKKKICKIDDKGEVEVSIDNTFTNAFRKAMIEIDPLFKNLVLKRIVEVYTALCSRGTMEKDDAARWIKKSLADCGLVYEGNIRALLDQGLSGIDYSLLEKQDGDEDYDEIK